MARLRAAFYGDDFTGSTDALFQFHRFGLRSTLFLQPPSPTMLRDAAGEYDVIGVAGIARSLPSASIEAEVRPVLQSFANLGCELVQYKICSTFDSSPTIGSFGPAIGLANEIFGAVAVPVLPAQPEFGRYTLFGNHFARAGNETFRLDRHPTMSRHPSTPIGEADLRRHLEAQTDGPVALLDVVTLRDGGEAMLLDHLARLRADRPSAIIFDALENDDLVRVARLLRRDVRRRQPNQNGSRVKRAPIVALGSGGLSYGFAADFTAEEPREMPVVRVDAVEKLLVVSGSCAPQTAEQIRWALDNGWRGVRVDPYAWLAATQRGRDGYANEITVQAIAALAESERGVVVFSALGPDTSGQVAKSNSAALASLLGSGLGFVVRQVLEQTGLPRAIIAGGDTSGYATQALGAQTLEIIVPLVPAGALCRLSSFAYPHMNGAEVMLKGGQVGNRDLFEVVRTGVAQ